MECATLRNFTVRRHSIQRWNSDAVDKIFAIKSKNTLYCKVRAILWYIANGFKTFIVMTSIMKCSEMPFKYSALAQMVL